ncbi:MAG: type II restriction endonuclease [Campylobacteraceae bacterium]|jgi:type II restriction enzyme|nr:type II restriction endonuclease [Campylobacteraceae bacterium]
MSERFELFLSQLSETNSTLDSFVDFEKIKRNVNCISIKLNQLNYLIGRENLKEAVEELYLENRTVFQVLDILIAVRKNKKVIDESGNIVFLETYFETNEKVVKYIETTGLADIFRNKNITNLVDYVFGIEVGLDTNARKNRGGTNMEKAVSSIFDKAGICYETQVNVAEFSDIKSLGDDVKVFDFAIKTKEKTYLIETNFYNGGGSKLNEVARAYSDVSPKINQYNNYEFVWITDGQGWLSAKNKLQEAFSIIPSLYNLTTLEKFISKIKAEGVLKIKI